MHKTRDLEVHRKRKDGGSGIDNAEALSATCQKEVLSAVCSKDKPTLFCFDYAAFFGLSG